MNKGLLRAAIFVERLSAHQRYWALKCVFCREVIFIVSSSLRVDSIVIIIIIFIINIIIVIDKNIKHHLYLLLFRGIVFVFPLLWNNSSVSLHIVIVVFIVIVYFSNSVCLIAMNSSLVNQVSKVHWYCQN